VITGTCRQTGKIEKRSTKTDFYVKMAKSPSRRTKKQVLLDHARETVTDFFRFFLDEQKLKDNSYDGIVRSWDEKANMDRFISMLRLRLPEQTEKKAKKKDPNAPKRNKSAYIHFGMEKRQTLVKDHPDLKVTQITCKLGELWRGLSLNQRAKYEKMATTDKERYVAEKETVKCAKGPKRNLSSYFFFCADMRAKVKESNPDLKITEIAKELGRMWKEDYADPESRTTWTDLAEKDKKRYTAEKEIWLQEHPEAVKGKSSKAILKASFSALPICVQEEVLSSPKTEAKGSWDQYVRVARKAFTTEHPDWPIVEIVQELKRRWSKMTDQQKAKYAV